MHTPHPTPATRLDGSAEPIRPDGRRVMRWWTVFTAILVAVAIAMLVQTTDVRKGESPPIPVVCGLLALAALALLGTLRGWWMQWKWRQCRLILDPHHAQLGHPFAGRIETQIPLLPARPIAVRLLCVSTSRTGKNESQIRYRTVWESETFVSASGPDLRAGTLAFSFQLPAGLRPTTPDSIEWKLTVAGEVPGRLRLGFVVPVVESDQTPFPSAPPEADKIALLGATFDESLARYEPKLSILVSAGETRMIFPARRHLGFVGFWIGLGVFMVALSIALWHAPAWGTIVLPVVFGLLGILLLAIGLQSLLTHRQVVITPNRIECESQFLFRKRRWEFTPDQISKIHLKSSGSAGDRSYYRLTLHTMTGDRVVLAELILGRVIAEMLREKIARILKLH